MAEGSRVAAGILNPSFSFYALLGLCRKWGKQGILLRKELYFSDKKPVIPELNGANKPSMGTGASSQCRNKPFVL
jgi:hypothetical protein